MADVAVDPPAVSAPVQAASPKKAKGAAAAKKPRAKAAHPRTADMVVAAVKNLKERGGSSSQAIKKYIAANYKVDAEKLAPFIKRYLKSAVTSGELVQTKGKGASGSFKLPGESKPEKKAVKKVSGAKGKSVKKSPAKPAKPAAKKLAVKGKKASASPAKTKKSAPAAVAPKKKAAAPKAKAPVKTKAAAKPKSPSKAKKSAKKPSTPKTKKTAAKKTTPKKK